MKEIARRRPIDRTAARVTSAGPKGYESSKQILQVCSPTALPLRPFPRRAPSSCRNLAGIVRGRLTVIGLWAENPSHHALWVCRCVCGYYVTRRARALTNPRNDKDRCDRCRELVYLRRTSQYIATGQNFDEEP
jgi:hypothetical protein